jgi:hypothetical protein
VILGAGGLVGARLCSVIQKEVSYCSSDDPLLPYDCQERDREERRRPVVWVNCPITTTSLSHEDKRVWVRGSA